VIKDKKVDTYYAVTHDGVVAQLHDKIVEAGIIIFPDLVTSTIVDAGKTSKGTTIIRYEATYIVRFVNAANPTDRATITVEAHANDYGDKAPGKCASYAHKTALLKMFLMETGVNDEGRIDARIAESEGQKGITKDQENELEDMIKSNGIDRIKVINWIKKAMKADEISQLNQIGYAETKRLLESRGKTNEAP